jgi:tetratricopeptide (TPR) repeat protein
MYKKALTFDQTRVQIWDQIARLEGVLERFQDMQETCDKALELFPNQPEFYLFRGIASSRQGDHLKATEALEYGKELVVDNKPLLVEFYSTLGSSYNSLKNYTKSDESYEQCLTLDPDNALVLNNYAYYLALRKAKLDKAIAMAKKCNEIQPNEISFQDTYAWVLFQSGNLQEALLWMEKVISSGKAGADEYEHYGDILISANRKSEALTNWKIAKDKGSKSSTLNDKISTQRYIE